MKTFGQLTSIERSTAIQRAKALLVTLIVEGVIEVKMPNTIVQKSFDRILVDMRQTDNSNTGMMMLFADKSIDKELDRISIAAAHGAQYDDNGNALMDQ